MYRRLLLLLLVLWTGLSELPAQNKRAIKDQTKAYLAAGHYQDAIRILEQSRTLLKTDEESKFLLAVCQFQTNALSAAKAGFEQLVAEEKSPYPECWWYLGKIYHAQQQFVEATERYKLYLRTLPADSPNRAMVIETIRRCDNGVRLLYGEAAAVVENAGATINSNGDEFAPVISPSRATQFYFSAIRDSNTGGRRDKYHQPNEQYGQARSDMFFTRLRGGQWQAPEPLHPLLNSPQHEYLLGFANEGQVLLYYQGWNWDKGVLFADTFQQSQNRSLTTTPFNSPLRPEIGEYECYLYQDTLLIFAARRPGGFGGLDLYRTAFRNSRWTMPENLGPEVNSAFDETAPFLARDGRTLYYSTNNSAVSVGGLDIVKSVYLPEALRWSPPVNMGLPINSPADDTHFHLSQDGFGGLLASARKDGFGRRDIYLVYFNKYRKEMELPSPSSFTYATQPSRIANPMATPSNGEQAVAVVPPPRAVPVIPSTPDPTSRQKWSIQGTSLANLATQEWLNTVAQNTLAQTQAGLVLTLYIPVNMTQPTAQFYQAWEYLNDQRAVLLRRGVPAQQIFLRVLLNTDSRYQLVASASRLTNGPQPVVGKDVTISPVDLVLCYKVQVVSVQRSYQNTDLDQRPGIMLEQTADTPYLRYTVGAARTFAEAEQLRRRIRAAGYSGAYIVPYVHGRRLEKNEVREWVSQYPDLNHYLGQ